MLGFLEHIAERFEVIVYCKGTEETCAPILDAIEDSQLYFAHRVYGNHVLFDNTSYSLKYYDFLLGSYRTIHNTIIMDTTVGAYSLHLYNGIPVRPFVPSPSDAADIELLYVAKYLEVLRSVPSVSDTIALAIRNEILKKPQPPPIKVSNSPSVN